jgi:dipeptidyl aminopeptidase/acylaminoacyl peptidase
MFQRFAPYSLCVAFLTPCAAFAQQAPTIEPYIRVRAPSAVTLAPDGDLYFIDSPDGVRQLFRKSTDGEILALTALDDGVSSYRLSPDGARILLSAAIGGSEQDDLLLLDADTGESTTIFSDPNIVYRSHFWLDDNSGFVYSANDDSPNDFHIYRYDLKRNKPTKLLAKEGSWSASDITNNGKRALVERYISAAEALVYELNTTSGALSDLSVQPAEGTSYNRTIGYLPGDREALIITDADSDFRRLVARDLRSGAVREALSSYDNRDIDDAELSDDGSMLAVTFNEDGYSRLRLFNTQTFEERPIPIIDRGVIGSLNFSGDTLTYSLSNARTPGLAFAFDTTKPVPVTRQLTEPFTAGLDLSRFSQPELITFNSFDGLEIPAFLLLPSNYKRGTPIPFIVDYHGGPEGQHRPVFDAIDQYFVDRGFGVLRPNVRGSVGYGREFHQLDNYKNRWNSVRDGVEAARWLVRSGMSAPGRIAAMGGSYGGFMATATVIEGGDLYGASVNIVGIVNFETFLEQTKGYRRKLREAEYGPLSDPEFLVSISPIHRIDDITVPMLIAHGLNDPRVPVGEAMQLAEELQKLGRDPETIYFHDEGHGFRKLDNRLLFYDRVDRFLSKHLND